MKAVGVIVEYNPFHNGHSYHLQAAKEAAKADIVIGVMSGNFLQRGEPALVSKWSRTKMALLGGVDIMIELPYQFASQKAETFANGAISILDAIGCQALCFGSESGDLSSFLATIDFLAVNQEEYNENIKRFIQTGVSYPKALSLSFQAMSSTNNLIDLTKPNNILGIQYIKALKHQNSSVQPLTIKRKNAEYHDEHFATDTIASATSIRKALFSPNMDKSSINQYVPVDTSRLLIEYHDHFGTFHEWENYWNLLKFRILQSSPEELKEIYEVEEGLENRILAIALESTSFRELMEKLKTKRYTWTRLQRMCVHILTNTKKTDMDMSIEKASYLRLLGITTTGKEYLKKNKSHISLPLISKLSAYKQKEVLLDIKATQIYSLGVGNQLANELIQQEYRQPPIMITKER